jgi:CheY-like chemotaxis protein
VDDQPLVLAPVLSGARILVIEDNEDSRVLLALMLSAFGAEVVAVGSGVETLEALGRGWPDLILSDIGLPDMDGLELFDRVRARAASDGVTMPRVIAVTAFSHPELHSEIYARGFWSLMVKPIDPQALLDTIRRALA